MKMVIHIKSGERSDEIYGESDGKQLKKRKLKIAFLHENVYASE